MADFDAYGDLAEFDAYQSESHRAAEEILTSLFKDIVISKNLTLLEKMQMAIEQAKNSPNSHSIYKISPLLSKEDLQIIKGSQLELIINAIYEKELEIIRMLQKFMHNSHESLRYDLSKELNSLVELYDLLIIQDKINLPISLLTELKTKREMGNLQACKAGFFINTSEAMLKELIPKGEFRDMLLQLRKYMSAIDFLGLNEFTAMTAQLDKCYVQKMHECRERTIREYDEIIKKSNTTKPKKKISIADQLRIDYNVPGADKLRKKYNIVDKDNQKEIITPEATPVPPVATAAPKAANQLQENQTEQIKKGEVQTDENNRRIFDECLSLIKIKAQENPKAVVPTCLLLTDSQNKLRSEQLFNNLRAIGASPRHVAKT